MSRNRTNPNAGYINLSKLPKGHHGRPLCRNCSMEVPKGRRSYCSDLCVDDWKIRSNPGYLREKVYQRDRGICAQCGRNCDELLMELQRLRHQSHHALRDRIQELNGIGFMLYPDTLTPGRLWQADHIVPVVEGGGECGLAGVRTLCTPCHKTVTAQLRKRLTRKK